MSKLEIDGKKNDVVIYITDEAYEKMWQYVKAVGTEIEGLGHAYLNTERDPESSERMIVIEDIFILEQEVTSASATIKEDAIHKYLEDKIRKGDMRPINVWWHSHADMGTFWSGTDTGTAGKFMNADWMIHIVGNLKGKYRAKLNIYKPYPIPIDDCIIERVKEGFHGIEVSDEIKKEVEEKVTKKTYVTPTTGSSYWNRNKSGGKHNNGYGGYYGGYGGYYDGYGGYHQGSFNEGKKNWDNDKDWGKENGNESERESEDYVFDIDHIFVGDRIWAPSPRAASDQKIFMKGIVIEVIKDSEELVVFFPKEDENNNKVTCSIEDIEIEPSEIDTGTISWDDEKAICEELYSGVTKDIKAKKFDAARRKIESMRKIDKWGAERKYNLNELCELMFEEEKGLKEKNKNKDKDGEGKKENKSNVVHQKKDNKNK
jgi:hypothetical protein